MFFRSKLKFGKLVHDKAFVNVMESWEDLSITEYVTTKEIPYNSNVNTTWHEEMRSAATRGWNDYFQNILVNQSATHDGNDLQKRSDIMFRRRTQQLCNDKVRCCKGYLHKSILQILMVNLIF